MSSTICFGLYGPHDILNLLLCGNSCAHLFLLGLVFVRSHICVDVFVGYGPCSLCFRFVKF
jgi:hypothetical protein